MTSELVLCKLIDIPESDAEARKQRSFNKEFAGTLAESVRIEGLLQPIVLRPSPAKPGRYLLVAGRHRLHAVSVVLKQETIESKVLVDMDETDASMAQIAENLWRNPLSKAQHLLAIQAWHGHYVAKYPDKVGARSGGLGAQKKRRTKTQADPNATRHDPAPAPTTQAAELSGGQMAPAPADPEPTPEPEPQPFHKMVSAATGEGERSVKRSVRIASAFAPDQIEIFDAMGVKQFQMEAVAAIKDKASRDAVVNLIASGMEPEEALAQNAAAAGAATGARMESDPNAKPDSELTDAEWAAKWCSNILDRLPHKARFLADVAFYRAAVVALGQFKVKLKKALAAKGPRGSLGRTINRITRLSHPSKWLICGMCSGTGTHKNGTGQPCDACFSDGYKTTSEG